MNESVLKTFLELRQATEQFIKLAPAFNEEMILATKIGTAMGRLETQLITLKKDAERAKRDQAWLED